MCGLFGFNFESGTVNAGRRAILANGLARLNDIRGGHSWGVCKFSNNGNLKVMRGLGKLGNHAYELINTNVLYAHTRFATNGEKTIENAHPFKFGNIIGAHNGVIYNHHVLCKKYERNFEVDSMHLFAHLSEGRDFGDIDGYGAIEWIDTNQPERIYLCRMRLGQLAIAGIGSEEKPHGIVWSSNSDHLKLALRYSGLINNAFAYTVDENQVYYVENNRLYYDDIKYSLGEMPTIPGGFSPWDLWEQAELFELEHGCGLPENNKSEIKLLPPHIEKPEHLISTTKALELYDAAERSDGEQPYKSIIIEKEEQDYVG